MTKRSLRVPAAWLVVMVSGLAGVPVLASHIDYYKYVAGVHIYLGVMPAETIRRQLAGRPEASMHQQSASRTHRDHVLVALFDSNNKRITDARVLARVVQPGRPEVQKALEPMTVDGALTYGNFFELPVRKLYRLQLEIRRPGIPGVIESVFEHHHAEP